MYKMLVSDFYGALINSEEAIALSTMIEIDRIRKQGVLFCITTSKSARSVIDYNKDFPFIDYVVAFDGNYVYDLAKQKAIYDKSLGSLTVKKIDKLFHDKDICFYTLSYCNYVGRYRDKDFCQIIIDREAFVEKNKSDIYKIKVFADTLSEAKKIVKLIKDQGLKVSCCIKEEHDIYAIEITNYLGSKLDGVNLIAKKNKFTMENVLAVCSSISSYQLLKHVGYGCMVENGDPKLEKVAKEITLSNEDKGVEKVIAKYF